MFEIVKTLTIIYNITLCLSITLMIFTITAVSCNLPICHHMIISLDGCSLLVTFHYAYIPLQICKHLSISDLFWHTSDPSLLKVCISIYFFLLIFQFTIYFCTYFQFLSLCLHISYCVHSKCPLGNFIFKAVFSKPFLSLIRFP